MNYNATDKVGMAAPLEWGHLKEVAAKELYKKKMVAKHEDFTLLDCGLAVSEEHPFVGASPDGMQHCKCSGTKLVEVKAIYSKKNLRPSVAAGEKIIYDQKTLKWRLKKETTWYYQVQCQMAVTKVLEEDLVIYTNKGIPIIPVSFDNTFWLGVVSKLEEFYLRNMVPETLFWYHTEGIAVNHVKNIDIATRPNLERLLSIFYYKEVFLNLHNVTFHVP